MMWAILSTAPVVRAGTLGESAAVRLQHMCDAVIALEAVRDDSGVARMVSDGARSPSSSSSRQTRSSAAWPAVNQCY
jgi:hypothetical protein